MVRTTQARRNRQAWTTLVLISLTFFAYLALNYLAGVAILKREYDDLTRNGALLIPAGAPGPMPAGLEERIVSGRCRPGDASCGEWRDMKSLDFTKLGHKNSLQSIYIVAESPLLRHMERSLEEAPFQRVAEVMGQDPKRTPLVLRFADSYAELTAWVNGEKIGVTSRHLALSERPFNFTNTDAVPIPLSVAKEGPNLVVVRAQRMHGVELPPIFRVNSLSIGGISEFMLVESIGLLSLVGSVLTVAFLLFYHFAVWLGRRRDNSNLAFVIYALAVVSQEFFFYNLSAYFHIPTEATWRARMMFVHTTPVAFISCAWAIGIPISHLWPHIVARIRGIRDTSFSRLRPAAKVGVFLLESVAYILFPIIALSAMVLPLSVSSTIIYKFSVPMSALTSFCFFFITAAWFFRNARKRDVWAVFPFAIAIAISQAGVFSGMLGALGMRQFSGLSVGYANMWFGVLFAITLANNFSQLHHQLERLRDRLEHLLLGTRDVSSSHETLEVVAKAASHVASQIDIDANPQVKVQLKSSETGLWTEWPVASADTPAEECRGTRLTDEQAASCESELRNPGSFLREDGEIVMPIRTAEYDLGLLRMAPYRKESLHPDDEHFMNAFSLSLAMSLDNIRFLHDSQERTRMEAELGAARAIQEALLPGEWKIPCMDVASHYQAASQTGGDWFGYHIFPDGKRVDVFIGDVTGHGIPSALLTGVIYGSVYSMEMTSHTSHATETHEDRLQRFGKSLHAMVRNSGRNRLMMTMALLSIDLETGVVTYLNAAHNPIIWLQHEAKATKVLANPGTRLGYGGPVADFGVRQFKLNPGDELFLYTDGLVENTGPSPEQIFSDKKLRKALETTASPEELKTRILGQAQTLWQDEPPADDVSLLVLQWNPQKKAEAA